MNPRLHLLAASVAAALLAACGGSNFPSTTPGNPSSGSGGTTVTLPAGTTNPGGGTPVTTDPGQGTTTPAATVLTGVALDGYLSKAGVFLDTNDNGRYDSGEPAATTDANGAFQLSVPAGQSTAHMLVVTVQAGTTVDQDTPGTPVTQSYTMMAPVGATVISPLTTLVVAKMSAGATLDQATAALRSELGLAATSNLMGDYLQAGQALELHNFARATAEVLKATPAADGTALKDALATIATQYTSKVATYQNTIRTAADPATAAAITTYALNFKPTVLTAASCAALLSTTVPASALSLPTGGATITSATWVQASDTGNTNGTFCKLLGSIAPASVAGNNNTVTPSIGFEVNLPAAWNGGFVYFGGGGFDGTLAGTPGADGLSAMDFAPATARSPLAAGYMTFGSDSGHQSTSITSGTFAANDEALANYGGLALKRTEDVALSIMRSTYNVKRQLRGYFQGSSTGGRDGMEMMQNWPDNYDAIFVNRPALNYTGLRLSNVQLARSLWLNSAGAASPAGWINNYKTDLLMKAVMSSCDGLDGLEDGIISNLDACKAKADATLATLRCADGADTGNTCLSDAQIATVKTMASPLTLNGYTLANGVTSYGGYNIMAGMVFGGPAVTNCATASLNIPAYGSPYATRDFGPSATGPVLSSTGQFSTLFSNWCPTNTGGSGANSPNAYQTGSEWMKYFIARQTTNFDPRRLDPATGNYAGTPSGTKSGTTYAATPAASYAARIAAVSAQTDATSTNLDAFIKKGGRLIWTHGSADEVVSTDSSVDYYKQLVAKYGQAKVDSFVRFYIINGTGHGDTGPFLPVYDSLTILSNWVDRNIDPADNIVMGNSQPKSPLDTTTGGKAQRPMCRYPTWPKFNGGDGNVAASFTCTR
jgi:feruloyl esterase